MVWRQRGEPAVHFSEPGEFFEQQSGIPGLIAEDFAEEKTAMKKKTKRDARP
jgi:hypothetical protein